MFNTKISIYGITIIISIICGLIVIYKNTKIINLKSDETLGLLIYIILGAIFGAKYYSYFTNIQKYNKNFNFIKTGLSSYGAVIGIILLLLLFSKQYKKKFNELFFIILPSIPLMYGIGKLGCFFSGCCYGIKYDGPFSIIYNYSYSAPNGVELFPIQLLESVIFIGIFIFTLNKFKKSKNYNKLIGETFIICGIFKFMLEYLRMSHIGKIITVNQTVSILFVLIGVYLIIKNRSTH